MIDEAVRLFGASRACASRSMRVICLQLNRCLSPYRKQCIHCTPEALYVLSVPAVSHSLSRSASPHPLVLLFDSENFPALPSYLVTCILPWCSGSEVRSRPTPPSVTPPSVTPPSVAPRQSHRVSHTASVTPPSVTPPSVTPRQSHRVSHTADSHTASVTPPSVTPRLSHRVRHTASVTPPSVTPRQSHRVSHIAVSHTAVSHTASVTPRQSHHRQSHRVSHTAAFTEASHFSTPPSPRALAPSPGILLPANYWQRRAVTCQAVVVAAADGRRTCPAPPAILEAPNKPFPPASYWQRRAVVCEAVVVAAADGAPTLPVCELPAMLLKSKASFVFPFVSS
ncbi:unnamed protein product, partial [Closterium sp. NIES-54]